MIFNQYPYLNLNDLNLDYILAQIKTMMNEVTNFVSINAIKYADPIQWDITRQYEKNTVVIDPVTGTAYISVAPVPAGVALTRPEYWTVVFDLGSFVTRAAQNFTSRYEQDTTLTATFSSNAGDWLVWGDVLYKALVNITAGDAYVVGSNIEKFTMEQIIGHPEDLNSFVKSSLVGAINSVYYDLFQFVTNSSHNLTAKLEDVGTTNATFASNAGDWIVLGESLYMAIANIAIGDPYTTGTNVVAFDIEGYIGHLNSLNTYVKTSIVDAINSVYYDLWNFIGKSGRNLTSHYEDAENTVSSYNLNVGDWLVWGESLYQVIAPISIGDTLTIGSNINALTIETEKNNINARIDNEIVARQSADSTLQNFIDRQSVYNFFYGKKILILGDSNSVENEAWRGRVWVDDFRDMLGGMNVTIDNNSVSGRSFSKYTGYIDSMVDVVDALPSSDHDYVIVFCGVNDWGHQATLGDMNAQAPYDFTKYNDSVKYCLSKIHSKIPSAAIFVVTPLFTNDYGTIDTPLLAYSIAMKNASNIPFYNVSVIDGFLAPAYLINGSNPTLYSMDGLHCNATYAPILARYIINSMISGGNSNDIHTWIKALNINSNVGSGNAWIKLWGNGETELYIYITLANNNYQGFLQSAPPSWIYDDFVVHEIQGLIRSGNDKVVTYFDSIAGNPYPDANYQNVGDIYIIDMKWRPRTLCRTDFV